MGNKIRLDVAVTQRGLCESREKAKAIIMAGDVFVNDEKCDKAGTMIKPDDKITVKADKLKYVSRGGLKLEKAMLKHGISLDGAVCMDIGASTGGFTDCMLQNNAARVYSIDVGYGQLAWKLRNDERVVNLERTNVRYLTEQQVNEPCDFASVDVSFISLTLVLPVLYRFLNQDAKAVVLVKPQFEAGKGKVGKKGVVREPEIHLEVVNKILRFCTEIGFCVIDIDYSPIRGPEGNIEYLFYIEKSDKRSDIDENTAKNVVYNSHKAFNTQQNI